ncbi:HAMP domain-containing methyl-accepting chemotaxis protein [Paenibacillus sp. ACRRX]|uniref:methyl-accepting chemotaxis protein n=1 Tax=Paenibacillus sp. ACRRX TaxID=2918206 RepID=UPI001EF707CE|nr:HAMP domain-containing methyl-accepting chemotaxis protein [Paenibacillus sp. ACRRX]
MNRLKSMSFFVKNLLLTSVNIILIGTILITVNYLNTEYTLTDQLHKQIETVTDNWVKGLDTKAIAAAIQEKDYDGPIQTKLRKYLSEVSKYNPNIAQAYVFGVELQDGNKTSLVAMPNNLMEDFKKNNVNIGDLYEQPGEVAKALGKMMESGEPTFTSFYSDMFGTWTTIAYPLQDSSGKIFAYFAVDADASMVPEGLQRLLWNGLFILLVLLVVVLVIQYYIVRLTLSPIKDLIKGIAEVSNGNFDVQINTGKDDLGVVNERFNEMVLKIRDMIVKVQQTSVEVTESARGLLAITEENTQRANVITKNMQEVSQGIHMQEQATTDSARAMAEMATVIQTIASSSSTVSDEAYAMEEKSLKGNEIVQQVATQMGLITKSVDHTSKAIKTLEGRSNEIGDILHIITGISSQTNLLALNASIEAARVGEHGKGFAVVAGEVRKLAEQSENSAKQIAELISEIQLEIVNAVKAMEKGTQDVQMGIVITEQTGRLFNDILNATKAVTGQIQDVSSATEEISAGTEELTATVQELLATAQTTAENSSAITSTVEEQTASMSSILHESNRLTKLSEQLEDLITKFHVSKDTNADEDSK